MRSLQHFLRSQHVGQLGITATDYISGALNTPMRCCAHSGEGAPQASSRGHCPHCSSTLRPRASCGPPLHPCESTRRRKGTDLLAGKDQRSPFPGNGNSPSSREPNKVMSGHFSAPCPDSPAPSQSWVQFGALQHWWDLAYPRESGWQLRTICMCIT